MSKAGRPVGASGGKAPALTSDEVRRLLAVTGGLENSARNLALIHVLLCGLRVSEPLAMRVKDVFDGRTVATSFVLAGTNTKTGKTRRVYLTDQAKKALATWINQGQLDPNDRVFALTSNYATTLVKSLMKASGLVGSSHSLRRTAANQLQEHGVSVRHIQDVLGHSHLNTTQIYLDASPVNVAKAVSTLNW